MSVESVKALLGRNLPAFAADFDIELTGGEGQHFAVTAKDGRVRISATDTVMACHAFYCYLQKYCRVQLSWCGNREIKLDRLVMFDGVYTKTVPQRWRVYMNYCTYAYSMCWWDFDRWEKEIDFMAMNGINMPLAVLGSEAVLYETLRAFDFSESEALAAISGPAFWPWQLMTNITGYLPPPNVNYVYERLELGRRVLARYLELGMQPIQQGFSGHVPALLKEKRPGAEIVPQNGWCRFPKTAQLDPLDPLFPAFGRVYLETMQRLLGAHHYYACDPFHEGAPPRSGKAYLRQVGSAVSALYTRFDPSAVWVMQGWSLRKEIVQAVPRDRLLVLDLNSLRTPGSKNLWGYEVVAGMLHDFGGKNAMQGKLALHAENAYARLRQGGANTVGSGMFMEGINQNPVVYDLQFHILTEKSAVSLQDWLADYIERRYGGTHPALTAAWQDLLCSCYRREGYGENSVGSMVAARPQLLPPETGPCCKTAWFYDPAVLERALFAFARVAEDFRGADGYQFDLCDLTRQWLSNRFHRQQEQFAAAYKAGDILACRQLAGRQLELLSDLDGLTAHRSEMHLNTWLYDAQHLATDEEEKRYFALNAKTLVTLWGDINGSTKGLFDYAWREWSGLIGSYYLPRWRRFYAYAMDCLRSHKPLQLCTGHCFDPKKKFVQTDYDREMDAFEQNWCRSYAPVTARPVDRDVVPAALALMEKYKTEK